MNLSEIFVSLQWNGGVNTSIVPHTFDGGMQTIETSHTDGSEGHFNTNGNSSPTDNAMDWEIENYINSYLGESRTNKQTKRVIAESQLRQIVKETVRQTLKEYIRQL